MRPVAIVAHSTGGPLSDSCRNRTITASGGAPPFILVELADDDDVKSCMRWWWSGAIAVRSLSLSVCVLFSVVVSLISCRNECKIVSHFLTSDQA